MNDNIEFVQYVSDIDSENEYALYLGDSLYLNPVIEFTKDAKEEDFEYEWVVGNGQSISYEKNLEWEIFLPEGYELAKTVPGSFVIKNKENGLEYRKLFTFNVRTGYAPTYLAIYETENGDLDWLSIQGASPSDFTRFFEGMSLRVNGEEIPGNYKGAMKGTKEIMVFTDHAPDYGYSMSLEDVEQGSAYDYTANVAEWIAPITQRVYRGNQTELNFSHIAYGIGGTKIIQLNDNLYSFNGSSTYYPVFDDEAYLKTTHVRQALMSKQFMRYKKAIFVRYDDNTVSLFHVFDDEMDDLFVDGQRFTLDSICGVFTEAMGLGSNQNYLVHVIGKKGTQYNLYVFSVEYVGTKVQPVTLSKTIPIPEAIASQAQYWYGAYAQRYGFYTTKNTIYKYDYLNIVSFPENLNPFISFSSEYEILDVFVQLGGTDLRDQDDCTVVFLYNNNTKRTTMYVYEIVFGEKIAEYKDVIPGKGKFFIKC
ncbi:MAG: hypothetical protein LIO65_05305 [Odoribacter sp.]|nr:hypothetical protein [Odoribacter sp.]